MKQPERRFAIRMSHEFPFVILADDEDDAALKFGSIAHEITNERLRAMRLSGDGEHAFGLLDGDKIVHRFRVRELDDDE